MIVLCTWGKNNPKDFGKNADNLYRQCEEMKMKMKTEHFDILKNEITDILKFNPEIVSDYENGLFPRSDNVKDLQKRFCFDLWYAAMGRLRTNFEVSDLYSYLNDDHIYTALKKICPTVVRKY